MRKMTILAVVLSNLVFSTNLVLARRPNPNEQNPAAACAACGGLGVMFILVIVVIVALNIALLVWVARDAKSRGMDSPVIWMILVMFTGLIGFVIYLFSRPEGNLIKCKSCNNNRPQTSAKCPHCGNA